MAQVTVTEKLTAAQEVARQKRREAWERQKAERGPSLAERLIALEDEVRKLKVK